MLHLKSWGRPRVAFLCLSVVCYGAVAWLLCSADSYRTAWIGFNLLNYVTFIVALFAIFKPCAPNKL